MSRVKITDEMLFDAVNNSESYAGVLRLLGIRQAGGSQSYFKTRIIRAGIDTSHFTGQGHNKGKKACNRKSSNKILMLRSEGYRGKSHELVRAMLEVGVEHKCSKCGQLPEWFENKLTLDIDHINENWLDDRIENLRFLCPNCHSQYSRNLIK